MLKNTASGIRLGALMLVWYLAIWSSASTHANRVVIVLYGLWNNFCGIIFTFLCIEIKMHKNLKIVNSLPQKFKSVIIFDKKKQTTFFL